MFFVLRATKHIHTETTWFTSPSLLCQFSVSNGHPALQGPQVFTGCHLEPLSSLFYSDSTLSMLNPTLFLWNAPQSYLCSLSLIPISWLFLSHLTVLLSPQALTGRERTFIHSSHPSIQHMVGSQQQLVGRGAHVSYS